MNSNGYDEAPVGVQVESPRRAGGTGSRRSRGQKLWTPRLQDNAEMPMQGPEVLDLLFRLGVLTAQQIAHLVPDPVSPRRMRLILGILESGSNVAGKRSRGQPGEKGERAANGDESLPALLRSVTHPFRYAGVGEPVRWRSIYYLSGEGLDYVARRRDLYPSVAESLYRGVLEEARLDHALLRNEFYRRLVLDVPRATRGGLDEDDGLRVETMWAEKGMTPIKLDPVEGKERRYLNPDGLLEIGSASGAAANPQRLSIFIESDTGSEDMEWQVTGHADKYAEHLWSLLESGDGTGGEEGLPLVLFVSPGPGRTRWVRRKIRQNGLDAESVFSAVLEAFKQKGRSLPAQFWFTNLKWLEENGGALGASFWPLSSSDFEVMLNEH